LEVVFQKKPAFDLNVVSAAPIHTMNAEQLAELCDKMSFVEAALYALIPLPLAILVRTSMMIQSLGLLRALEARLREREAQNIYLTHTVFNAIKAERKDWRLSRPLKPLKAAAYPMHVGTQTEMEVAWRDPDSDNDGDAAVTTAYRYPTVVPYYEDSTHTARSPRASNASGGDDDKLSTTAADSAKPSPPMLSVILSDEELDDALKTMKSMSIPRHASLIRVGEKTADPFDPSSLPLPQPLPPAASPHRHHDVYQRADNNKKSPIASSWL